MFGWEARAGREEDCTDSVGALLPLWVAGLKIV